MIAKDNLINALEKSLANEEEFILSYGKEFLQNVLNSGELTNDEKEGIEKVLSAMLEDTERHKNTVLQLLEKIKKDKRNEF